MQRHDKAIKEIPAYEAGHSFVFHQNIGKVFYPAHWHHAVEIIMPLKESVVIESSIEDIRLNEFDILIIPPDVAHSLKTDHEDGQRLIIQFELQILNNIQGLASISSAYSKLKLITKENAPELHRLTKSKLMDILDEYLNKEPYYKIGIICKIIDFTVCLSRNEQNHDAAGNDYHVRLKEHALKYNECIDFIKARYKDNITLDMAADSIGFSRYHFSRWFRQCAGITFTEYLAGVRIEKAKYMLLNSTKLVIEIAFESGFQSIGTFNRVFKEITNYSPKEYQKLYTDKLDLTNNMLPVIEDSRPEAKILSYVYKFPPRLPSDFMLSPPPYAGLENNCGLYYKPSLFKYAADSNLIRIHDVYYMIGTTMYFSPHCPVMKSPDLVNWEIINYVCDILDDSDACTLRGGAHSYGKGTLPAGLSFHNGTFYVTTASCTTNKTYIFQTEDIENGPWRRYELNQVYDNSSLFFDDDSRVYLLSGSANIRLIELTFDAVSVKPGGLDIQIINNPAMGGKLSLPDAGLHFYKINGRYYLFPASQPPSGLDTQIQLCYRADYIEGPYEVKVIFNQGRAAEGGIIDTPAGDWYAVNRVLVLTPFTWDEGWPVFNTDTVLLNNISSAFNNGIVSSDEFYPSPVVKNFSAVNNTDYRYRHLSDRPLSDEGMPDREILVNGDFINGTDNWCVSYVADFRIVNDEILNKPVMMVSNRAVTSSGLKQFLCNEITPGRVYEVKARIRYISGPPEKEFVLSLFRDTDWSSIRNMAAGKIKRGEWGTVRGLFTLPADSNLLKPAFFIETTWLKNPKKFDDLMDFYVDSVSMAEKPKLLPVGTAAFENDLNGSNPALVWQWNHNPDYNLWSLTERPGYLRLKSGYLCRDLSEARNTLTQRVFGPSCLGSAALDTGGMKDGDFAGLAAINGIYGYIGVKVVNSLKSIIMVMYQDEGFKEIECIPLYYERIYFCIEFDFSGDAGRACFYYSEDEVNWVSFGGSLDIGCKAGHYMGYRFALFYYATQLRGGYADFDYYRISDGRLAGSDNKAVLLRASFGDCVSVTDLHVFELPVHMDALPLGSYAGIFLSFNIPGIFDVVGLRFNSANISGVTDYQYEGGCLRIFITGEGVGFVHNTSDLLAVVLLRVRGFAKVDRVGVVSCDYVHVEGGSGVYCVHGMSVAIHVSRGEGV